MTAGFSLRMALREGRSGIRRVGTFMLAVALGVAALTGLHAFQQDAADGAAAEARTLLGGDLRIQSGSPFPGGVDGLLDSLSAAGIVVSRSVSLGSMVSRPDAQAARLLQVVAVDARYPPAGRPRSSPPGAWEAIQRGGVAADASTLRQLGVGIGDSLRIGSLRLEVTGSVEGLPVDPGIQSVIGPPVFVALDGLEGTGLVGEGSLAQFRASLLLPAGASVDALATRIKSAIEGIPSAEGTLAVRTAREEAEAIAEGFSALARFLGLVGFVALLLGGVGVASAVQLYVRERLPGIAVLRCLGAGQGTVFRVYLLQACLLGVGGAGLGVLLGLGVQFSLPGLLSGLLPFRFEPRIRPATLGLGLGIGTGVAVLFALFPLLRVREIPPLAALRIEVEPEGNGGRVARFVAGAGVGMSVLLLAALQTGGVREGAVLTLSLCLVLGVLWGFSWMLAKGSRRLVPDGAPFVLRQGVAGIFRPGNQTGVMLTSLGFGAFLLTSVWVVSEGLRDWLALELSDDAPALLLFDIQDDQRGGVEALLGRSGAPTELVPVVPGRIRSIDGVDAATLQIAGEGPGWALRRLYRNTSWGSLRPGEEVTEGRWWDEGPEEPEVRDAVRDGSVRVSLEDDLAEQLGVRVGSRIVWDVQGRPVPSVVSSLRTVDWSRFQPNFFAVFEPGALDGAPSTWIGLAPLVEEEARMSLQGALLESFPNVSFLDLSSIRETVYRISGQVTRLLAGMALFVLAGGFVVVFATLLTGRILRRKESAILRTLGGDSPTIRRIFLVEYALLGGIGTAAGVLLGAVGGFSLLRWGFGIASTPPLAGLLLLWFALAGLTLFAGWSLSGPILRAPPRTTLEGD